MASGEARRAQDQDPRPVAVRGRNGRARWHPLWRGNPRIATPQEVANGRDVQLIVNGPGCRPYIDHRAMARDFAAVFPDRPFTAGVRDPRLPWRFTDWRAARGELPSVPLRAPGGYLVVEPHIKPGASPNKQWGWARWQALVHAVRDARHPWIQLALPGARVLDGVTHIPGASFVEACAVLSGAAAAVLPDGGLHHAAAALGVPAVVVFGGYTSPANLGYDGHINLFESAGGQSPCGQRVDCAHCRQAMDSIRPEAVAAQLEHLLNARDDSARKG